MPPRHGRGAARPARVEEADDDRAVLPDRLEAPEDRGEARDPGRKGDRGHQVPRDPRSPAAPDGAGPAADAVFGALEAGVKECPELKDLAHLVETGEADAGLRAHLAKCDACQEARQSLEEEATSLQISISELWFREQVSCPDASTLEKFRKSRLGAEEQAYVDFHLETLKCPTCQGRMGEAEVAESVEVRSSAARSRKKVADASIKLIGDLKQGKRR